MAKSGWIGVDLDGTLAHYEGWRGIEHIGAPVPAMLTRVLAWLAEGTTVKIFTARAFGGNADAIGYIESWCLAHIGQVLPVTCVKDFSMIELWDDRAVQICINTGRRADGKAN